MDAMKMVQVCAMVGAHIITPAGAYEAASFGGVAFARFFCCGI